MTEGVTQGFILDQPGKFFFFFARFGAKNSSDLPEANLKPGEDINSFLRSHQGNPVYEKLLLPA
jgi:hypothetical protein